MDLLNYILVLGKKGVVCKETLGLRWWEVVYKNLVGVSPSSERIQGFALTKG